MKHNRTELLIDQESELRKLKLPPKWSVAKIEVTFKRSGFCEDYAEVIYDSLNKTFYIRTDRSIIYPSNLKTTQEAIRVMNKANRVIKTTNVYKKNETQSKSQTSKQDAIKSRTRK